MDRIAEQGLILCRKSRNASNQLNNSQIFQGVMLFFRQTGEGFPRALMEKPESLNFLAFFCTCFSLSASISIAKQISQSHGICVLDKVLNSPCEKLVVASAIFSNPLLSTYQLGVTQAHPVNSSPPGDIKACSTVH